MSNNVYTVVYKLNLLAKEIYINNDIVKLQSDLNLLNSIYQE